MNAKHKTIGLFTAALGMVAVAALMPAKPADTPPPKPIIPVVELPLHPIPSPEPKPVHEGEDRPVVQVALLLDTSNSMDGLIDQARSELWRITRQLAETKRGGKAPRLELALYEYGNDRLSAQHGYIRQVIGFTEEVDRFSEQLFGLTTSGGQEYAGFAIRDAVVSLPWSSDDSALKLIFIAGNESFDQGPVLVSEAMNYAKKMNISVNPIFCGAMSAGVATGWQQGATLAGGHFMAIDHNKKVVQIQAPQDAEIAQLSSSINNTYIPYGRRGNEGLMRQSAQDSNSGLFGLSNQSRRGSYKGSAAYVNPSWELVDAIDRGVVNADDLDEKGLPSAMRKLDEDGRRRYIEGKRAERRRIQKRIRDLTVARDEFVKAERAKQGQEDSLDVALLGAVEKLARAKGFEFE